MKYILIAAVIALTGCSTVTPVTRNFPDVPQELLVACPELKEVEEGTTKLSEVLKVVTNNYSDYHECRIKMENWIDWYKSQKQIFDSVK